MFGEEFDFFFGLFREFNIVSFVDVFCYGFNFIFDVERRFVFKFEVFVVFVRFVRRFDGVGERDGVFVFVCVMGVENGVFCVCGERDFMNYCVFCFGVGWECVDGDDDWDIERFGVFDVAD